MELATQQHVSCAVFCVWKIPASDWEADWLQTVKSMLVGAAYTGSFHFWINLVEQWWYINRSALVAHPTATRDFAQQLLQLSNLQSLTIQLGPATVFGILVRIPVAKGDFPHAAHRADHVF